MSDFLPEYHYLPVAGGYRPAYRLFAGKPFRLVPDSLPLPTVSQAIAAAKEYVKGKLNPEIRCEKAAEGVDPLGVAEWHEQRAARAAHDQEAALGAVIVKGRQVKIERRRRA